jgi:hypothetical protein
MRPTTGRIGPASDRSEYPLVFETGTCLSSDGTPRPPGLACFFSVCYGKANTREVRPAAAGLHLAAVGGRRGQTWLCAVKSRGSSVGAIPTRQLGRSSR